MSPSLKRKRANPGDVAVAEKMDALPEELEKPAANLHTSPEELAQPAATMDALPEELVNNIFSHLSDIYLKGECTWSHSHAFLNVSLVYRKFRRIGLEFLYRRFDKPYNDRRSYSFFCNLVVCPDLEEYVKEVEVRSFPPPGNLANWLQDLHRHLFSMYPTATAEHEYKLYNLIRFSPMYYSFADDTGARHNRERMWSLKPGDNDFQHLQRVSHSPGANVNLTQLAGSHLFNLKSMQRVDFVDFVASWDPSEVVSSDLRTSFITDIDIRGTSAVCARLLALVIGRCIALRRLHYHGDLYDPEPSIHWMNEIRIALEKHRHTLETLELDDPDFGDYPWGETTGLIGPLAGFTKLSVLRIPLNALLGGSNWPNPPSRIPFVEMLPRSIETLDFRLTNLDSYDGVKAQRDLHRHFSPGKKALRLANLKSLRMHIHNFLCRGSWKLVPESDLEGTVDVRIETSLMHSEKGKTHRPYHVANPSR
jgi:hypothetical protein